MGYGETTRRGRRQYVAHELYERKGVPYMRMHFYVHGNRNRATVQLDVRQVRRQLFAPYTSFYRIFMFFRVLGRNFIVICSCK